MTRLAHRGAVARVYTLVRPIDQTALEPKCGVHIQLNNASYVSAAQDAMNALLKGAEPMPPRLAQFCLWAAPKKHTHSRIESGHVVDRR